ncbi:MAG: 16S rRNA processing protein RimM [Armatimonadetes bacterium]|jgi:16S rRNA processing protein RimM|nr:16S rRNA processing protein RimM [Armatimonadota bacterium]
MTLSERDIVIGKIAGPLGIKGEVKVVVLTDFPERFTAGSELEIRLPEGKRQSVKVQSKRLYKDGLALMLEGVDTRGEAEAIRGAVFVVNIDSVRGLPDGSFYVFDLIGLKVVTTDGRECGSISEIMQGGANDVYVTSTGLCIPALKEVVEKIDIDQGVVVIRPVPGLLD